jgi:streptogramin lyase
MTLTASSSPVDSYQWYLDGNPISGATNASVTVGQNLSLGHYDLNVVVRKGTILSSTSTEFNVVRQMTFGSSGSGSGQLGSPWGIALDSSGRIYVADTYNNRVVRMDNMSGSGWTAYGSYGPNTGQFYDPLGGIAVDSSGRIYVADTYNNRIVRMDDMSGSGWTTLHPVSAPYQFTRPCGIAVDSSGRIYVADANNHRIVRMDDMNGSGWTSYGSYGSGTGQLSYPRGIAVDSNGRIYAADSGNNRITRMDDMSGSGWTTYGTAGSASGQFRIPNGIVVDAFSRIYVADTNNCRIVSFSFP